MEGKQQEIEDTIGQEIAARISRATKRTMTKVVLQALHPTTASVTEHVKYRFYYYLFFGGMVQRISEKEKRTVGNFIAGGASQYQDQHSGQGPTIHAAHFVRVSVKASSGIKAENMKELEGILAQTQNIDRYANTGGIGRLIDEYQSNQENLDTLWSIDFGDEYGTHAEQTIQTLKDRFVAEIDKQIVKEDVGSNKRKELEDAKDDLKNMNNGELFAEGGYSYFMPDNPFRNAQTRN